MGGRHAEVVGAEARDARLLAASAKDVVARGVWRGLGIGRSPRDSRARGRSDARVKAFATRCVPRRTGHSDPQGNKAIHFVDPRSD